MKLVVLIVKIPRDILFLNKDIVISKLDSIYKKGISNYDVQRKLEKK